MDQLIDASLSHTHYWYEMGMLKIPSSVLIIIIGVLFSSSVLLWQRLTLACEAALVFISPDFVHLTLPWNTYFYHDPSRYFSVDPIQL